ncbi:MAG: tetratricopeptide repeat protein, partial [candidate division Zixibacteria bacterium]|nr:tetratricopeptide repeat protein [candidate division Zixibacteria bacterium]
MKALISGQVGTAVLIEEEKIASFSIDDPDQIIERSEHEIHCIFHDATDFTILKDTNMDHVLSELDKLWKKDRAMHMLLILLDNSEDNDTRQLASECLEEYLSDDIEIYLTDYLYTSPLPSSADLTGALEISQNSNQVRAIGFFKTLEINQSMITKCNEAWNALPIDLFETLEYKEDFRMKAISAGAFRLFVIEQGKKDKALLDLLLNPAFKGDVKSRAILQQWAAPFKNDTLNKEIINEDYLKDTPLFQKFINKIPILKRKSAQEKLTNVEKNKLAIKKYFSQGKYPKAWKYTEYLIEDQRISSEPKHISQTLCDLAQHAKSIGDYKLQLKLSEWAIEEMPNDGWAYTQLGDAYRLLNKFDEALNSFEKAASFGEKCVAHNGRAEVLKAVGRFDKALMTYEETIKRFPNDAVAYDGRAEVLKAVGRFDEALIAYEETIKRFPENEVANNGRAEVLKAVGRFDEALMTYEETIKRFPNDAVAYNGRAEVLKAVGRFDEALMTYEETIKRFPNNVVAYTGRAEILKAFSRFDEALIAFEETIKRFPENEVANNGRAEVLKAVGR